MAHVPASPGARYGGRSSTPGDQASYQQPRYQSTQYQPPVPQRQPSPAPRSRSDDGWDAPTQHVSSAYAGQAPPQAAPPRPTVQVQSQAPPRTPVHAGAHAPAVPRRPERGVSGWLAVLVLIAIAGVGGGIDLATSSGVKSGFNISIVVAAVVAILIVRHSAMFPVVVAPPLVYFAASAVLLYARSGGLHDRKVLLDSAANWLVYGFPAIAGATAAVLIIAGIRLISGK